jgi:peptidoglycan/LPS O-acetylase OafA/YrhL
MRSQTRPATLPKTNNFDLIRLAAALQVAVVHVLANLHREIRPAWLAEVVDMFPGVPIFFFISGFLISKSFEKNPRLGEYALNRALRIYPALFACFGLAVMSAALAGYFRTVEVPAGEFLRWVFAQLSFFQFYNPEFMRQYGVGVLNGSTWTISVELQFYFLIPAMYLFLRLRERSIRASNQMLVALLLVFLALNQLYIYVLVPHHETLLSKLALVSFAPWFYMFLLGVLCQRNFAVLNTWLAGRFAAVLAAYLILGFIATRLLGWGFGNNVHPLLFVALAVVVFAGAFSGPTLSDRLLSRNDLSYGVYIYHAPVLNFLLAAGYAGSVWSFPAAMVSTCVLAFASWRFVEKPALGYKKHPLYRHGTTGLAS